MCRLTSLKARQAIFGNFPETQKFSIYKTESYNIMLYIMQLNIKYKNCRTSAPLTWIPRLKLIVIELLP